jgi:MtrB/PioB family decaheme-associated outer membrane protein
MRNFCKAFLLSTVCLAPLTAFAQDQGVFDASAPSAQSAEAAKQYNNEISFGLQDVNGSNTNLYGRYNGFSTQGLNLIGDFSLHSLRQWDSGDTNYWDLTGVNLNLQTSNDLANGFTDHRYTNGTSNNWFPEGSLELKTGKQGTWGIRAYFNSISYTGNIIDSLYTVNGGLATMNNGLLPWGGASPAQTGKGSITAFTVATLSPYMSQFQVGTRRDIVGGEGKYIWGDWTVTGSLRHEHKEGTMEESLRETYGGQAFTMPVDYDTDRYDLSAAYNTRTVQAVLQYTFSHFVDNNLGVSLPYPVSIAAVTSGTQTPFAETGIYATPPSTDAHYLTAMVGYNPMPSMRINLNGRVGWELQNAPFAANTGDPGISPSTPGFANLNSLLEGTTAPSLNARATVYHGTITVSYSPLDHLDGHFFASIDGRDVSLDQYKVWIGGSSPDAAATTAVYVVPQQWLKDKIGADIGYMILPKSDTKLAVSYQFDKIDRSNAQVGHSDTSTVTVDLSSKLGPEIMSRLSYEYSNRSGVLNYGTAWGNLEGNTGSDGAPSGAYYQAPMTSNAVKFRADYSPSEILSAGIVLQYRDEAFHYPAAPTSLGLILNQVEGIKEDSNLSIGPDLNFHPIKDFNAHLFYTYEQIFYDNRGNGACSTTAQAATAVCLGTAGFFKNDYTSSVHTVGISLERKFSSKFKASVDYTYSRGSVAFSQYNGVFVSSVTQVYQNETSYPDIDSTLHSLRMKAQYLLTSNMELSLVYAYNMFRNNDWNDLAPAVQPTTNGGSAISVLTPGYSSPNYDVSTFMAGVKIRF